MAITNNANDIAFQNPLSNNIIANSPKVALIPYKIITACFCENPLSISLWCKCPLSALKTALIDFPFIILLIIANEVSNIGSASTNSGATIIRAVYVFATPIIDITDNVKPIKFEPVSPIKVLAGLKLNGKKPNNAPANAVANIIEIIGDSFMMKIINRQIDEISEIPVYNPSNPSVKFMALVIPIIHITVNTFKNTSFIITVLEAGIAILSITVPLRTTANAARSCPINFIIGLIPFLSSK